MNNKTVIKRQGLMRLIFTLSHTFNGLKWMSRFEAAFQQELVLFSLLGVFACLQEITLSSKLILIASLLFVLFAELVNTAVEVVVDRIGSEYHELSGLAKDIASASVFIAMLIAILVWWSVLWT
ncbi:MAG: diacylglycerol kinase (ATP) [Pseudoalteromonas tetraodonis]|jgi:diacylglycerol kinase (ATP)|uniref:Diacylglycerol kinase n=5 Tax=Pseudoalteromonas TaxID=53246 RepID=A0AA37S0C8_9GAMM|nr:MULTISPECIES: diacylglycerol kinase [Pseudoalteromonas]MAY58980.1 diacylglycerol kinase [Pseudoalteromonas sp.]ADT67207.1 diacylglycerol kinase (DAGK) [Pseudoalteromonas sp. SM9913]ALQ53580.1 Diacylglycerol kinase (DAGK) [Pseudoalteromonas issachenkonii]ATC89328.1 diacylglycerol kinase (ATP dependent) [Pseudoalteromonas issachenkonii]ATD01847.1 diacylglycerol kinase (ATP dependent) [Pseudoalteromonas tetraodonis]|tara:strand:- start:100 stop:471 length:372 start_codon:yes stop_codon:yes gene_type:complete